MRDRLRWRGARRTLLAYLGAAMLLVAHGLAADGAVSQSVEASVIELTIALSSDERELRSALREKIEALAPNPGEEWLRPIERRSAARGEGSDQFASVAKQELLAGQTAAVVLPVSAFLRQSSLFGAFDVPFLATPNRLSARLESAVAPLLGARLAEDGLVLLALMETRPVALYGAAGEASGELMPRRVQVVDAASARFAELIGAEPVRVAAAVPEPPDQPPAVFRRMRPGEATPANGRSAITLAWRPRAMLVVRRDALERLAPGARERLERLAKEVPDRLREVWGSAALPVVQDGGAREARLREAGKVMAKEWAVGAGADGVAVLGDIERASGGE